MANTHLSASPRCYGYDRRKLVGELLQSPLISKVQLVGRRNCNADERKDWPNQDKLVESIVNMDHLDAHRDVFTGHSGSVVWEQLELMQVQPKPLFGSTRTFRCKQQHSQGGWWRLTTALCIADIGRKQCRVLVLLYPKTKVSLNKGIGPGFSTLAIMRPGLIDYRPDNRPKHRAVEQWAAPLLGFIAPRSSLCGISQLGHAMRRVAETWLTQGPASHAHPIVKIYENDAILDLAESK
ncbi:hypothetical protein BASA83_006245 [Batrachochytrium salamandrivorans]|nr:hypothetical protein BASA83_006245 [Batrachochytrium salamandrivorans]